MTRILDVQKLRVLEGPDEPRPDRTLECDLLVAGGGMGGCAAALAACRAGRTVVLTEETDWLGGQMTSQGVSALDEHPHIETFGGTRSYYELRALIREYYRQHTSLSDTARQAERLNPGNGWVSYLCFEPAAGVWALEQLLEPHLRKGRLTLLLRHRAVQAEVKDGTVRSVTLRHLDGKQHVRVRASFVLDATELGDLLPLTGTDYVTGAEASSETGEPHAPETAHPEWSQSFTYPFALERLSAPGEPVSPPEDYELNRERQPYTLRHLYHDPRGWVTYRMFETGKDAAGPFWTYRRLLDARNFNGDHPVHDLAMINWPGNDFRHGSLIDVKPKAALKALRAARDLSLGFCHWLQTECPRDEGGTGYPELALSATAMGTQDGLAKYPYIRESRRIRALRTVTEGDISASGSSGVRARMFADSVGIGLYAIDIHPAEGEEKIPPAAARPFQIPLSALVPVKTRNLLPACKNIGTTHITNGAYRLHPIEWAIGEAVAAVAVFCLDRRLTPQELAVDEPRLRRLQRRLVRAGVPLFWYTDLPLDHPAFEAMQVLSAWGVWPGRPDSLAFGPSELANGQDLSALTRAPRWARAQVERVMELCLPRWTSLDRETLARTTYEVLSL